eukprot:scaffold117696_cov63-Phaeocystis_antarctica.AAC.3
MLRRSPAVRSAQPATARSTNKCITNKCMKCGGRGDVVKQDRWDSAVQGRTWGVHRLAPQSALAPVPTHKPRAVEH